MGVTFSKLLINEPPLQVLPTLACLVGLNESIVLQQVQYWLYNAEKSKKMGIYKFGRWWIYNTMKDWRENFPFWSTKTTQRAIDHLREKGLLLTARLSDNNLDQTLYYAIDYNRLDLLLSAFDMDRLDKQTDTNDQGKSPFGQDDQMGAPFGQDDQLHLVNLTECSWSSCPTVNIDSSETTSSETTQRLTSAHSIDLEKWEEVRSQLKLQTKSAVFEDYIKPLEFRGRDDHAVYLGAADSKSRDWIASRLKTTIERLFTIVYQQPVTVQFDLVQPAGK